MADVHKCSGEHNFVVLAEPGTNDTIIFCTRCAKTAKLVAANPELTSPKLVTP